MEKPRLKKPVHCEAYTPAARLDGVCDFLIGQEMFANQDYPDRSASKIVKLGNGGDSS